MDVHCATCNEPWDTYHLQHDEVHETEAGQAWIDFKLDTEDWEKGKMFEDETGPKPPEFERWEGRLTDFWREQFKLKGWEFGTSVVAVLRCPACPAEVKGVLRRKLVEARKQNVQLLSELLEGDEDGQAADNWLALKMAAR